MPEEWNVIKFILVGVGVRGRQWARVIHEEVGAQTIAYVDRRFPELSAEGAFDAQGIPCFTDLAAALDATEPDAMVLATPPHVHHQQIMMAFHRGLHVLAEKPLAEDLVEALDLVGRAEESGLQLMVGMNFRYLPAHQAIRRMIRDGQLGEPSFAQFTYLRHRDGRRSDLNDHCLTQEQPMLLEQSIHHLDLMRYCYDREVIWVQADTWNPPWSVYQDDSNVSALLCFEGGLRVNYLGTWTAAWNEFNFRWRTDCSGGVLIQKAQFDDLYLARFSAELALTGERFKSMAEPLEPVELPPVEYFVDDTRGLFREFIGALRSDRPVETSARDHLKTLALIRACIEAARTGQRVQMDHFYQEQGIPRTWL
jgi:predicted dehydrogenase